MSQKTVETMLDVRQLPPGRRHSLIFETWNNLQPGSELLLVNDHDPLPLYYQFACEWTGQFHWEYVESGPAVWRVRLQKGSFPNPGFKPARANQPGNVIKQGSKPLVLDTRPIFERGETPCGAIDDAVAALAPGQPLILQVPFEPVPLYTKLKREGFSHHAKPMPEGGWEVEFRRSA